MPPRIDSPALFPAARGGYIDVEKFRHREWAPALTRRRDPSPPRVRHAAHVRDVGDRVRPAVSNLSVVMGTSIRELEDTYFRWPRRTDEQLRAAFDSYDAGVSRSATVTP